jgi:3-methylcrotonyl-CoA carboxylase alpha subunit
MFGKVLIANRGEIAVRIARSCRALGVRVVAVYSDADRSALHVRAADEALRIGPSPVQDSYLNVDALLDAARQAGAEAIHPGYGFLSESAAFAERVAAAGLVFIGPPPAAMRALGDKAAAKRLMIAAGVPVVPGYEGDEQSDARLTAEAERIGYPLMVKAAAGGGGRGMREVRAPGALAEALASARREALGGFGDDRLLLERLVSNARHVEVQIFADAHGDTLYLGERDCSTQRRHQKLIEESPSPAVDADLRRRMGEAAVRAARSAGYVNAGTVEFLLAEDGAFYFLEMNTRLQVEHPVTELVTGLDLVAWQLRIAAGEPLPLRQDEITLQGHAIEARLYAEDPAHGYLPASGRLSRFAMPRDEGVRVDAGFAEGDTVNPFYDALLAKIAIRGANRAEAVARLRTALSETVIDGPATNLAQLRAIAASRSFADGAVTIDWLERLWTADSAARLSAPSDAAVLAAAALLLTGALPAAAGGVRDLWSQPSAWRVGGVERALRFSLDGAAVRLMARPDAGANGWRLEWDGAARTASFERQGAHDVLL